MWAKRQEHEAQVRWITSLWRMTSSHLTGELKHPHTSLTSNRNPYSERQTCQVRTQHWILWRILLRCKSIILTEIQLKSTYLCFKMENIMAFTEVHITVIEVVPLHNSPLGYLVKYVRIIGTSLHPVKVLFWLHKCFISSCCFCEDGCTDFTGMYRQVYGCLNWINQELEITMHTWLPNFHEPIKNLLFMCTVQLVNQSQSVFQHFVSAEVVSFIPRYHHCHKITSVKYDGSCKLILIWCVSGFVTIMVLCFSVPNMFLIPLILPVHPKLSFH